MEQVTSQGTVRLVIIIVGLVLLTCVVGAIVLVASHVPVPDPLWTIGSTALGAETAMLVSTRGAPPVPAGGELDPDA